ncbi:MFS transporter [Zavarzinia sp. CC-PAN008]|uniref:MFS transporter n=1 Tax=Zavarzinia sp. CC-PAN008 TaxID=3243332 RepID=UPI003F7485A9
MSTTAERLPAGLPSFIRIGIAQTIPFFVYLILPGYVAALAVRMGFGEQAGALIASANLAGIALGTFLGIALVKRFPTRSLMLVGLLTAAALDALSPFVLDVTAHGALRAAAGLAGGVSMAMGSILIAKPSNAERGFSVIVFCNTSFAVLMLFFMQALLDWAGMQGLYWLVSGLGVLTAFMMLTEPLHDRPASAAPAGSGGALSPEAIMAMLAFGLFLAGFAMVWTFLGAIGLSRGLNAATVGTTLSIGAMVGLGGALTAGIIGTRFGRIPTLGLAVLVVVSMMLVIWLVPTEMAFLATIPVFLFFLNFSPPFFAGLLADLDPSGRVLAASTSVLVILNATAPAVAAALVRPEGYGLVIAVGAAVSFSALPLYAFAASRYAARRALATSAAGI